MIAVEEAKQKTLSAVRMQPPVQCPLHEAVGRVLASNISSPISLPLFDNSSVDGYAVRSADISEAGDRNPISLAVKETVAAGESISAILQGSPQLMQAVQVLTGAMIPPGADAVIRQEDVTRNDDHIIINRPAKTNECIRFSGEEIQVGDAILEAREMLTPAGIGLLAGLGINTVSVFSFPNVGVLVTGSEIITDDTEELTAGKIFDSNSFILSAALREMRLPVKFQRTCKDNREELKRALAEGLEIVDFMLVTGGVSVGKFDYVKEVAAEIGIEEIFWRVRQKPGKPLFSGATSDGKILFGLPGNPASVLTSFYEYVRPALMKSMGATQPHILSTSALLKNDFSKSAGLTHFLKGRFASDGTVEILDRQASHMMSSFARANCLVVVEESVTNLTKGDLVEIHLLPS